MNVVRRELEITRWTLCPSSGVNSSERLLSLVLQPISQNSNAMPGCERRQRISSHPQLLAALSEDLGGDLVWAVACGEAAQGVVVAVVKCHSTTRRLPATYPPLPKRGLLAGTADQPAFEATGNVLAGSRFLIRRTARPAIQSPIVAATDHVRPSESAPRLSSTRLRCATSDKTLYIRANLISTAWNTCHP